MIARRICLPDPVDQATIDEYYASIATPPTPDYSWADDQDALWATEPEPFPEPPMRVGAPVFVPDWSAIIPGVFFGAVLIGFAAMIWVSLP